MGKMKAWRKAGKFWNEHEDQKNQGRKFKFNYEMKPEPSGLLRKLLIHASNIGNLKYVFTKAQQKKIDDLQAQAESELVELEKQQAETELQNVAGEIEEAKELENKPEEV